MLTVRWLLVAALWACIALVHAQPMQCLPLKIAYTSGEQASVTFSGCSLPSLLIDGPGTVVNLTGRSLTVNCSIEVRNGALLWLRSNAEPCQNSFRIFTGARFIVDGATVNFDNVRVDAAREIFFRGAQLYGDAAGCRQLKCPSGDTMATVPNGGGPGGPHAGIGSAGAMGGDCERVYDTTTMPQKPVGPGCSGGTGMNSGIGGKGGGALNLFAPNFTTGQFPSTISAVGGVSEVSGGGGGGGGVGIFTYSLNASSPLSIIVNGGNSQAGAPRGGGGGGGVCMVQREAEIRNSIVCAVTGGEGDTATGSNGYDTYQGLTLPWASTIIFPNCPGTGASDSSGTLNGDTAPTSVSSTSSTSTTATSQGASTTALTSLTTTGSASSSAGTSATSTTTIETSGGTSGGTTAGGNSGGTGGATTASGTTGSGDSGSGQATADGRPDALQGQDVTAGASTNDDTVLVIAVAVALAVVVAVVIVVALIVKSRRKKPAGAPKAMSSGAGEDSDKAYELTQRANPVFMATQEPMDSPTSNGDTMRTKLADEKTIRKPSAASTVALTGDETTTHTTLASEPTYRTVLAAEPTYHTALSAEPTTRQTLDSSFNTARASISQGSSASQHLELPTSRQTLDPPTARQALEPATTRTSLVSLSPTVFPTEDTQRGGKVVAETDGGEHTVRGDLVGKPLLGDAPTTRAPLPVASSEDTVRGGATSRPLLDAPTTRASLSNVAGDEKTSRRAL